MSNRIEPELNDAKLSIYPDEKIDLSELLKALWKGRLMILICILLFAIASFVYAFNAQQWWIAKAVVTTPKVTDVVTFNRVVKRYQPAFDVYQPNGEVLLGKELDNLIGQRDIFERFVEAFNASNNKREFLTNSLVYAGILNKLDVQVDDQRVYRLTLREWSAKLNATVSDKNRPDLIILRAESITDESSFMLLNDYISFINEKVKEGLMEDLRSILQIKNNELLQQLESRLALVAGRLKLEIGKAEKAFKIANAAQIRRPVQNLNKQEIFAIDLGADAIREKVNVLKTLDDLSILDPNISEINNKLNVLKRELPPIENLSAFSYLETVEVPLNLHRPKRALIVVLGTLLGGMLGLGLVLVRFFKVGKN